jgi:hypothetical protein
MGLPVVAVTGAALVTAMSAEGAGATVVVADAELLAGLGSASLAETVAVLVTVPAAVGVTTMVRVEEAPTARLPTLQLTVPLALVHPDDADPKVTLPGRVSVTDTPLAGLGPLLVTTTV